MPDFHLSWDSIVSIVISSVIIYLAVILCTRLYGIRSFSKISSFDFATTIAIGSVMAATIVSREPNLLPGLLAVAILFALQTIVGILRNRSDRLQRLVDNEPVLLMDGSEILESNLEKTGLTCDDLREKLREANVLSYDEIRAVVFETTGKISVLSSRHREDELEPELLQAVRRQA